MTEIEETSGAHFALPHLVIFTQPKKSRSLKLRNSEFYEMHIQIGPSELKALIMVLENRQPQFQVQRELVLSN